MGVEFKKTGVIQGSVIERPTVLTIEKNDYTISANLAKNTFGTEEKGYTVPSSGGSEGGPIYAVTNISPGQVYTVSAWLKGNANMNLYTLNSGGDVFFNWINKGTLTDQYKFYTLTFTAPSNKGTINSIYICTRYTTSPTPGDWFKVWPNTVKIEAGSRATPWIPHSTDSIYNQFNFSTLSTTVTNPVQANDIVEN